MTDDRRQTRNVNGRLIVSQSGDHEMSGKSERPPRSEYQKPQKFEKYFPINPEELKF